MNDVTRTCVTHDRQFGDVSVSLATRNAIQFTSFQVSSSAGLNGIPCSDNISAVAVDFTVDFTTSGTATTVTAGDHVALNTLNPPTSAMPTRGPTTTPLT